MNREDPKGYYALLNVSSSASASEIKAAFRRRAMEVHPDTNTTPYAVQQFQQLNEAFEVLSDSATRAEYDTLCAEVIDSQSVFSERTDMEPIACSCCAKVTAQPRYVIFYEVKSFIFFTIRSPIQGIFCHSCAEKKVLRSTIITYLLGWWGFPWGIIYSLFSIIHNLFGGSKPHDVNARLLTYQAYAFATQSKFDLARAVAEDAHKIIQKSYPEIPVKVQEYLQDPIEHERVKLLSLVQKLLSALETETSTKRLHNKWSLLNRPFYIQSGFLLIALQLMVILSSIYSVPSEATPNISSEKVSNSTVTSTPKPKYTRPSSADNGTPFPSASGYIKGYSRKLTDGYSTVTVDNSQNNSDVFVKLFSLNATNPMPIRVFFIRAGEAFTVENIKTGTYDVRTRDLDSGRLSRTEQFTLEEFQTVESVRFSRLTLTLYKVSSGNMQSYPISEDEF
jgi:DnaJ domain